MCPGYFFSLASRLMEFVDEDIEVPGDEACGITRPGIDEQKLREALEFGRDDQCPNYDYRDLALLDLKLETLQVLTSF